MISGLTIIGGVDKNRNRETVAKIELKLGETISILGPTGSGKTALITDIEMLSQGEGISKRKILIDGRIPTDEQRYNALHKPVVMITQNTKCFSDLYVADFLEIHARARGNNEETIVDKTISLANTFSGEEIKKGNRVTELSGGQTRSLLFADALTIGISPFILLDEIENAGINKLQIINNINFLDKLVIFVTHDPIIALLSKKRIIMQNGSITKILNKSLEEDHIFNNVMKMDSALVDLRECLRLGKADHELNYQYI